MGLWITDSRASTQEIERGIAAAKAHFEEKGSHPQACWQASLDAAAAAEPVTDENTLDLINTWHEAENLAIAACCEGWARIPESALLVWE